MADNLNITQGSGTEIATDQVGTSHYQKVKIVDGTADSANPLKVNSSGEVLVKVDNIGDGSISIHTALPTGGNVIGSVGITAPLPAGTNLLGSVGITQPLPSGTNTLGSIGLSGSIPTGVNSVGSFGIMPGSSKIGRIDVADGSLSIHTALPAGTNTLGSIGITQPLPTGTNTLGSIGITGSIPGGTNTIGSVNSTTVITHPASLWYANAAYAAAGTAQVKTAPGAGLCLYLTDVIISNGATAGTIRLVERSDTNTVLVQFLNLAANGGTVLNLRTPIKVTGNTDIVIHSGVVTNYSVNLGGYVAP